MQRAVVGGPGGVRVDEGEEGSGQRGRGHGVRVFMTARRWTAALQCRLRCLARLALLCASCSFRSPCEAPCLSHPSRPSRNVDYNRNLTIYGNCSSAQPHSNRRLLSRHVPARLLSDPVPPLHPPPRHPCHRPPPPPPPRPGLVEGRRRRVLRHHRVPLLLLRAHRRRHVAVLGRALWRRGGRPGVQHALLRGHQRPGGARDGRQLQGHRRLQVQRSSAEHDSVEERRRRA